MEQIAWGFGLPEGPTVDGDGALYVSDVVGGGVHRIDPDGTRTEVIGKRRGVGGLALHADGGLIVTGRDLLHVRDGTSRVVLPLPPGGTGFNDLTAAPDGSVLVGLLRYHPMAGDEVVPGEVWRVRPDGGSGVAAASAAAWAHGIDWPNGIGLSPDGRDVYVSEFRSGTILRGPLADGAELLPFARSPSGDADGLAVDDAGGVLVALGGGGGVARFDQDGTLDRVLDVPATFVSSVCFGGDGWRDLYVTAAGNTDDPARQGTVFRTRTRARVPGLPVPPARV